MFFLFSQGVEIVWRLQIPHCFSPEAGWIQSQGEVTLVFHAQNLQVFLLTPGILFKKIHADDCQKIFQVLANS